MPDLPVKSKLFEIDFKLQRIGKLMTETTEPTAEPEMINATLVLAETIFGIFSSLMPMIPLQIQQGDIESMKRVDQLSQCMNRLGELLVAMGSELVKPVENPSGGKPSGLILPN